ncbi:hypothetical protein [Burkholderia stagnalis]|uniref:hypothetical protein n=1 Tax=Burkholderia stagnalis TaxID=1503054 RepID=UPI001E4BB310|nr:hypothetical protein [Burkholderia stagnalis]
MVTLGSNSGALPSIAAAFDQPAVACDPPPPDPPPVGGDGLDGVPGVVGVDSDAPPFVATSSPPHAVKARQVAMIINAMGFMNFLLLFMLVRDP